MSFLHVVPRKAAVAFVGVVGLSACAKSGPATFGAPVANSAIARGGSLLPGPKPAPPPERWLGLLGEYDAPAGMRLVLEDGGRLWIADTTRHAAALVEESPDHFTVNADDASRLLGSAGRTITFVRQGTGPTSSMNVGDARMPRRNIEPGPGTNQLRITPVRSVEELRVESLAASPPKEQGSFHAPELVELTRLDPTIRLEIRYATTNNFLGTRFYDQARAFMQQPAAQAGRARESITPSARLRSADSRCVSAVVCHEDVLGRDAARQAVARGESSRGIETQSRRGSRSHSVRLVHGPPDRNAEHV